MPGSTGSLSLRPDQNLTPFARSVRFGPGVIHAGWFSHANGPVRYILSSRKKDPSSRYDSTFPLGFCPDSDATPISGPIHGRVMLTPIVCNWPGVSS